MKGFTIALHVDAVAISFDRDVQLVARRVLVRSICDASSTECFGEPLLDRGVKAAVIEAFDVAGQICEHGRRCSARFAISDDDQFAARSGDANVDEVAIGRELQGEGGRLRVDDRRIEDDVPLVALESVSRVDGYLADEVGEFPTEQRSDEFDLSAERCDDSE